MAEETPGKKEKSMIPDGMTAEDVKIKPKIYLFLNLMEKHFGPNEDNGFRDTLRQNDMTGKPEYFDLDDGHWKEWDDLHESQTRNFFQQSYGLYSKQMLEDAISIYFGMHHVNPVLDMLNALKWDGKPRVEHALHDVMKCEDTPYIRECSRLIFAGGVHRAFNPGCKFDDMIVLIGNQGAGKSTFVRWLNMEDRWFREIKTISGKEGIEAIRGVWIGEVAELMAMTRVKESEAVKAYITSQEDSYRPPYAKHVVTIPRRCCFIGTTNNPQFLSDKTGNRRFYPVKVCVDGYALLNHEKEVRDYIAQAWAEAVQMFHDGKLQPFAKKELLEQIRAAQAQALEDDWRIGAIEDYLENMKNAPNAFVSVVELWHRALKMPEESAPTRKDSIEIAQIITSIPGWVSSERRIRTPWGIQRAFEKRNDLFPVWR